MTLFSIITPVFNPPLWAFEECIDSVLNQGFADWEWCIADDCSTNPDVIERLRRLEKSDPRIRLFERSMNGGIVAASNDAFLLACGEYVVLLDHDDSLSINALEVVAELLRFCPDTDYVYSNEDKVDRAGNHFDTFYKPTWSPERLLGQNYCCHLSVIRRALVTEVGGFREGFDGSQDYDLILRIVELAKAIRHIPEVLYHWRVVEGSTALDQFAKPYAFEAARRAVDEHLKRRNIEADVLTTSHGFQKIVRKLHSFPMVSIIIPSGAFSQEVRGSNRLLLDCAIKSIIEKSSYPNYEIVVVLDTNKFRDDPTLQSTLQHECVVVVDYDKPFDFSDKCNVGAVASRGDILLFLNDDTEVISPDWLETLVGHLEDPSVGMVGARLLFENETIQSAGHTNDPSPHSFGLGLAKDDPGMFGNLAIAQERSGLTGACFALSRDLYMQVGGMSRAYPHCFNDVDLCCKVLEHDLRLIWTPFADLYHFESLSRDPTPRDSEIEAIYERWGRYFGEDKYLPQPEKFYWDE
jgi:GT2 family glycosyltransferase